MMPQAYQVTIMPLAEADGDGFAAVVPELPGCRSDGDTPEQALANAYDAVACWIEAAEETGRAVPTPARIAA